MPRAALALIVLIVSGACATGPVADPDGELRILGGEPGLHHLDPQQATSKIEVGEVSLLFDTLLTYDRGGATLIPSLARTMPQVSSDGLTYTISLQSGLTYSDGRAVLARDFVFAFQHLCDPATQSDFAFAGFVVAGCERFHADDPARTPADQLARDRAAVGVVASDDRTVSYHLAYRAQFFPHLLASWLTAPTREDLVARGDTWTEAGTYVGNGLFRLVSWTHRKEIVFERNEQHRPKAKLKRIVMNLALTPNAALAAYRNGEIDVLDVSTDIKRDVDGDAALAGQSASIDSVCATYFSLNVRKPPFDDANVRLAFAKAVDRDQWVRDALGGLGTPATSFIPPGVPGHDADDNAQAFDPAAARDLLARSRYAGAVPTVLITYPPIPTLSRVFQALADGWRSALDVDVRLSPIDPTTVRDLARPETYPQLISSGWCAAYPDAQDFLSLVFVSGSGVGRTNYANPAYDSLVHQADGEPDVARRAGLYRDAQRMLTRDAPAIFMASLRSTTLVSPRVHGQTITRFDRVFSQYALSDVFVPARPSPSASR